MTVFSKAIGFFMSLLLSLVLMAQEDELSIYEMEDEKFRELFTMDIKLKLASPHNIHHMHEKGDIMVRIMHLNMAKEGLLDGSSELSLADANAAYMVAPKSMDMSMDVLGVMYAPTDDITLMFMIDATTKSMDLNRRMMMVDTPFSTDSSGIGDFTVDILYALEDTDTNQFIISAGLSIPTAKINHRDDTPMAADMILPYGMQLGSGTVDPRIALTYIHIYELHTLGFYANARLRLYDNYRGYHLGDEFKATGWITYFLDASKAIIVRLDYESKGNISGEDDELVFGMSPMADPDQYARESICAGLGFTYLKDDWQFYANISIPIHENVDGIQLEKDLSYSVGITRTF
ncbi:MAG: transporter [Lentisphaeria bacterium]|nr:transporter [Lentisphaeria bacterium]